MTGIFRIFENHFNTFDFLGQAKRIEKINRAILIYLLDFSFSL